MTHYMRCTVCCRETHSTGEDVLAMFDRVRSRKRRTALISQLCSEWRCDECLDDAERDLSQEDASAIGPQ